MIYMTANEDEDLKTIEGHPNPGLEMTKTDKGETENEGETEINGLGEGEVVEWITGKGATKGEFFAMPSPSSTCLDDDEAVLEERVRSLSMMFSSGSENVTPVPGGGSQSELKYPTHVDYGAKDRAPLMSKKQYSEGILERKIVKQILKRKHMSKIL
eukprot:UN30316